MPEPLTELRLTTQASIGILNIPHFDTPKVKRQVHLTANLILAMSSPDGTTIYNPNHSAFTDNFTPVTDEHQIETIKLPVSKAERLAALFAELRPEHELDCHDLVAVTEEQTRDHLIKSRQKLVRPAENVTDPEEVIPGIPYSILAFSGTVRNPQFEVVYSGLGTNNGRLLGLLGRGGVLATTDPETTKQLYAADALPSYIVQTIEPAHLAATAAQATASREPRFARLGGRLAGRS